MLVVKRLDKKNFQHFLTLLEERGEAPVDYYEWKYLKQPYSNCVKGFVAYNDNNPIGCIGVINRVYQSADGNTQPITWFADWYVNKQGRGLGVGLELMKAVRSETSLGFGIPGPQLAQIVCQKAGYMTFSGFYEGTVYLRPFICGYKRGGGSIGKRIVRGFWSALKSIPTQIDIVRHNSKRFQRGFPSHDQITHFQSKFISEKGCLIRDELMMQWMKIIPTSVESNRFWWSIEEEKFYSWGYVERDFWGLNRVHIMDVFSHDFKPEFYTIIGATLLRQGADMMKFITCSTSTLQKYVAFEKLPLHVSGEASAINGIYLAGLDKESSWREFVMYS